MILADSSIWIHHFRSANPRIGELVRRRELLMHSMVVGELALGNIAHRQAVLRDFAGMRAAPRASDEEVLGLIESNRLWGRGIGFVDAHLLASVLLVHAGRLWTADKRLHDVAREFGVAAAID